MPYAAAPQRSRQEIHSGVCSGEVTDSKSHRPLTSLRAENEHPMAPAADSNISKGCTMGNAALGSRLESKGRLAVSFSFLFLRLSLLFGAIAVSAWQSVFRCKLSSRRITDPQALAKPRGEANCTAGKNVSSFFICRAVPFSLFPCLENWLILYLRHSFSCGSHSYH